MSNQLDVTSALDRTPVSERGFFHSTVTNGTRVITAFDLVLDDSIVSPHDHLEVYAFSIRLRGKLRFPGKQVQLHAHTVLGESGSQIDVSGFAGDGFRPGFRAKDGQHAGARGTNGENAQSGKPGGTVTVFAGKLQGSISLLSNGGIGGRGQDGGYGARGGRGADGRNARTGCSGFFNGQPGGQGGTGGDAGNGGSGGNGGNAGRLNVKYILPPEDTTRVYHAQGGDGGDPGGPGQPREGGPGGQGGLNYSCEHIGRDRHVPVGQVPAGLDDSVEPDADGPVVTTIKAQDCAYNAASELDPAFRLGCICDERGRAATGPQGRRGRGGRSGAAGKPGSSVYVAADGTPNYNSVESEITYVDLYACASINAALMVLHKAELAYLNEDFARATELLLWLEALSSADDVELDTDWSPLRQRVVILLSQLRGGLDFFGMPPNYVPLVALDVYKEVVERLLNVAQSVEDGYRLYWTTNATRAEKLDALNASLGAAVDALITLRSEQRQAENAATDAQNIIAHLALMIERQEEVIRQAEQRFRDAVRRRSGCDFFETLRFVGTIVSVAAGMYQNITNIIDQFKSIAEESEKRLATLKGTIRHLEKAGKEVQSLSKAYQKIRDLLDDDKDAGKIVVTTDDFEQALEPFMSMDEAKALRDELRRFVELVKTRNRKILDYTGLTYRIVQIGAEIRQRESERDRVDRAIADKQDPDLVEAVTFLAKLLTECKAYVIQALYKEHRAFEYWSLSDYSFRLSDMDVARLRFFHGDLLAKELWHREDRNRSNQRFVDARIVIARKEYKEEFERFYKYGDLSFRIPRSDPAFQGRAAVTVSQAEILVAGARSADNRLRIKLVHHGVGEFVDSAGRIHEYSHAARATTYEYDYRTGDVYTPVDGNLGGSDGQYAYLSPFAQWTVRLDPRIHEELRLSGVQKVTLVFGGYFLPPA